ncbi:MAG: hypothetical protein WC139_12795 [Candidatus Kapaibacterium sp.]
MKTFIYFIFLILTICVPLTGYTQIDSAEYEETILSYNVPESPGFTVLGVNPNKVVSGINAKPLVINVLGQLVFNDKLTPGFAMDFSPSIFGMSFNNRNDYRKDDFKRILFNSSISVAAIKDKKDTNSTKFGLGFRITLLDETDLLMNEEACEIIQNSLVEYPSQDETKEDDTQELPALKKAYKDARSILLSKTRHSLSVGYGVEGIIKNSIINKDSIIANSHSIWVGGQSTFKDFRLLYTYQARFGTKLTPENLLGMAIKTNKYGMNAGCELLYNFKAQKFEGALSSEIRIVNNLSAVIGLSIVSEKNIDEYITKLNLVSNIRYNIGN